MKTASARQFASVFCAALTVAGTLLARNPGALTLTQGESARATGLGEAFAAMDNDIAAAGYNPAVLQTLDGGQASFMFQRSADADSYGHFSVGRAGAKQGLGLSIGYYSMGNIDAFDGSSRRSVKAQTDLVVSALGSLALGCGSLGLTAKYLSSELAETVKATAFAADLGFQAPVNDRVRVGLSAQNIGPGLTYESSSDPLPTTLRAGVSFGFKAGSLQNRLLLEEAYGVNESQSRPGLGIESLAGPLALRLGVRRQNASTELTVGAGIAIGASSFDYSFGLAHEAGLEHHASLSVRFAGSPAANAVVRAPEPRVVRVPVAPAVPARPRLDQVGKKSPAREVVAPHKVESARRVYVVQDGDSLASIARKLYGDPKLWRRIYQANQHLIKDPTTVAVGSKLVLPDAE